MCKLIIVLSFFGVIGVSVGQIIQDGTCDPNINLLANFDVERFLGTWHEIARADTPLGGDCSNIELRRVGEGITVTHDTVRQNFYQQYVGTASLAANTAKLTLNLPQASSNPIDFWVINTDYVNYALTYGCENVGNTQRRVYIWQLGRETSYPNEMIPAIINTQLQNLLGISSNQLQYVSHNEDSCYQLPLIQQGQPIILPGQCNQNVAGVPNFDAGRFLGVWFNVRSYYSENAQGTCNRAQYSDGGDRVNVANYQVVSQSLSSVRGFATVATNDNSGKLNVVLQLSSGDVTSELIVLATDYEQWAVTYTCNNLPNNQKRVFSWVSSRTRQIPAAAQAQVDQVINSYIELNEVYYTPSDLSDASCFYYPEPLFNEPVVFGGQCDMSIPVVNNFQADAYMGLWHEIEKYPTPYQFGTCSNAFYELVGGQVDVFNTQVVNERLDTINGNAVPVADGKLVVTFPVLGTNLTIETDYWVLSTDYTSYSLVYSCRNLNEYQKQVTVWKLSRTKQLTAAATTAINNVIGTLDVLNQNYFQIQDQSVAGCFYYPEAQLGVPVVFPGQCETDIPVIPNFNLAQFQGEWFEIQTYPKIPQSGQCINHQFTPGTGSTSFNFVSSSVEEQLSTSTNGQLVLYPGETGGRFTLSFTSNNQVISFPYYVIATDYNDFALVYSCLNINNDFRGIWSWKLSRSKQLSANAQTQINNALSASVVLNNDYYEPVDQSDDACFYFPELAAGESVILPGQCDANVPVVQNFDAARYLGRWRLISSYPSDNQLGQCNQQTVSLENGNIVVSNNEVFNQELSEISGTATIVEEGVGKLLVTFPNIPVPFELWILGTDYDSYSYTYGCVNVNNQQRRVYSWKLSRTTSLTPQAVAAISQITNNVLVLNERYYQTILHTDAACFYYPTPGLGPNIFRGQCDENIPVVTNFDAVAYMGLWHDVESYAVPFQDGSCPNAFYTLNTELGRVEVFNTQVINQTLDTITGSAVLEDSTDGSAKLQVTFPFVGFSLTTPYWVLASDYTNYALVYSCTNVDEETRSVSSWKLSRTKTLSPAATTAINNIVNRIDVLDQRYYNRRDQSADGCFYYPEAQLGVPVVFPGQCDVNIPVVQNFDLNQFQGEWFEVQTYPKEPQPGECIAHQFSTSTATVLDFISTSITDQLLGTSTGTVTLYANQNGGRFTLRVVGSNGLDISFPYYIIATDYNNYALAYSCLNINNDFRGVWAWKLSRTKSGLTAAANAAIDTAMANIEVLNNDYFEPVDQTDDACFYFPELGPGEPVILPGQCDDNVPFVRNFDAARYLGRWRLIQSYPSDRQLGQCNQQTISVEDGNIIVYNAEVRNQELSDIRGVAVAQQIGNEVIGKLLVTFPNVPVPFELWIVDTDYDSYSYTYGCVNVNNQQRRVYSWKLSRTTSLTPEAEAAISQITNNVTVLNDRYYQNVLQTDAACFYYPTPGSGPNIFRGQCDENIPVVTNFDAVAYMGLWHNVESYAVPFQDGSCPNAFYTLNTELGRVEVFNTQVINQTLDTITGSAVLEDSTDGSAKLQVTFPFDGFSLTTPYWVLASDYTNYALVYSCSNIDEETRSVSSWKLSRTKTLSPAATTAINNIVNRIDVLDQRYYNRRDQSADGCFYYPEAELGVPVVFPGQCDANLPVVNNFNLAQFQGVWNEVQTYPKEQQTGECINHRFTVNGNSLDLESYNVIAESLGVTYGTVSFTSTDNSARMLITFTSATGQTLQIPYWIIDTDYTSYAVAYSCVNIDQNYRGVWSWKLSRTKQLSAASNTAINNAIANIDVLSNEYYETVNQTDEACFFYPDVAPGQSVVFPGQCDANIATVQNFDAGRYLGLWRTVASYPSDFQLGTCGEATYTLEGDVVIVFNTEVVQQSLSTIYGNATVIGDGKLSVVFPDAPFPVEYWVLDTDYDTYSLVYSCVNINSDQRRIFSWKLSRTNTLPQAAITAINQKINTVNVLDDRYYATEDRTPAGCFYYPEPSNTPVIFRGQCDQNIPVVTNFNAVSYAGIWYSIESYPAPFQDGTCGTASYTLNADTGVVFVENTQVVNQVLDVQTGTAVLADGTNGKLLVTFEVGGVTITTEYWVLATDYTSYAFVYSCQNVNEYYKQVNSWKLSRTKALPAAAVPVINNIISNVQVLEQQYFVPEGQSEDDCFFYPDNNGGDVILTGQCTPDNQVPAITNFNVNSFAGTWHEVARFPSDLQQGECAATTFTPNGQNSLTITQTIVENESQTANTIAGTVTNDGRGVISATVNGVPFDALYILDTDYTEYALVYGCRELPGNNKQIYSWKLSRSREGLSASANNALNQVVSNNDDLFEGYYSYTQQTNQACFHYPVIEELPEEIKLPGPCDDSIRGIANFDAGAYTGRWVEIERYPQPNQFGACDRAHYTASVTGVDVRNTQVVGNALLVQLGSAVVASNDGTGQLTVNFNVNGIEVFANYYIIDTDYTNYALVYSCRNTDDNSRLVSSWKLSRTTSLSAQANTAINAAIARTEGLAQEYYQQTLQTEEACFYIPEVDQSSAPLFRGQCEAVSGVANFDVAAFVGWWHEIERYPVDSTIGQCISSEYDVSGSSYQVIDTHVADQTATVVSGTVTATTDGKLTKVFSNGVRQEIVVLATDYNNYALLYSCEDIVVDGEPYRRVWSAKHSKTRQLTQAAQNAMAPLIDSSRVLYPQFYLPVDQNDAACFHYPEVSGNQVILPGQCDENIGVVQNFDVPAYGGTWYQIERYPQIHENGISTCIGARYVLNEEAGVVDVLNWEVIDGELETIEGTATVVSTDGSAKLSVILPVVGTNDTVETPLYVLTTDYESYSLAYSCSNVGLYRRSIGAWKLSRDRTMSSEGVAAIESVIAQRAELDARYFLAVKHDEECEEPSSGSLVKSSLLVMLVCVVIQLLY